MEELDMKNLPKHIAIILDGNRRWARREGLEVVDGHKEGAANVRRIAKFANKLGIKYMTVYAFSTENWNRSKLEVTALMQILGFYLTDLLAEFDNDNVKINFIGKIEGLANNLQVNMHKLMEKTSKNTGLVLNIAFNYGGRDDITTATKNIASKVMSGELNIQDINEQLISDNLYTAGQPDPDLIIRTSGEQRISNFLLWQIAYSEFLFVSKYWPEFTGDDLIDAIKDYQQRSRRFGGK